MQRRIKIGIIGNMNNAYFSLARYLRDKDYDCELLIFDNEPLHFAPSHDTDSTVYEQYCKRINWGDPAKFLKEDFKKIAEDLKTYNFLIGNGPAPAYVAKIGRRLDIFMPYGYDLYSLPFFKMVHPFRLPAYLRLRIYQRKGIKESAYTLFDRANTSFEKIFSKLQLSGERIISPLPMLYHKEYEAQPEENGKEGLMQQLSHLRAENDLLFVQHARQIWKKSPDFWSYKGNNFLIEGFGKFIQAFPSVKAKLILFDYGADVKHSKKLIAAIGLSDSVVWMPKMPRKKLMKILSIADLIVGELFHSWNTYGVVVEALCMGKPFMHKRIDKEFSGDYEELYPMLHADSAATVFNGLEWISNNKRQAEELATDGRAWFMKYCVEYPLEKIDNIIKAKQMHIN